MAKKEKVLEHTSALQQNRTDPDMKVKPCLLYTSDAADD